MKHYRIVRIAGIHYNAARADFYGKNAELSLQSYADQQKALFQKAYVYSDSFSRGMRLLGHESYEIVYDLETLQRTWAEEKSVRYDPEHWQHEVVLAQIKDIRPDVLYFQDIYSLPQSIRNQLKAFFPFIRVVVMFRGAPSGAPDELLKEFGAADVLLVGCPVLLDRCSSAGLKPHLVYHSFDEAVLEKIGANPSVEPGPKYDFTFVGSSGFGRDLWFQARYWALAELIERTPLELWVDELVEHRILVRAKAQTREFVKNMLRGFSVRTLEELPGWSSVPVKVKKIICEIIAEQGIRWKLPKKTLQEVFPGRCHAPIFGIDMYRVLHQSKVTLNKNSARFLGTVGNMRLFEATGVGACLLTDTGTNMSDLFEQDYEVVTYSSIEECVEKVGYLLGHDDVRRRIAAAGQARTLKCHRVLNRCQEIDDILQKIL